MKLSDFAYSDDTVKVEAVAIHDMPTVPMQAVDERFAHLYLYLRDMGVSEELAQSILKLVRFEVES